MALTYRGLLPIVDSNEMPFLMLGLHWQLMLMLITFICYLVRTLLTRSILCLQILLMRTIQLQS